MTAPECSVDGCDGGGELRRGWCALHYQRWRRNGTTDLIATPAVHGTPGMYTNHGCRCPDCRAAHAAKQKRWRAAVAS